MKRKRSRLASIVAVMIITVLLAGCGSSNNDGSFSMNSSADRANAKFAGSAEVLSEQQTYDGDDSSAGSANANSVAADTASSLPKFQLSEPPGGALGAVDRKLMYQAQVTIEVADYGNAQTELFNLITISRGYILNFYDNQTRYELGGSFVIKVPTDGFQSFLTALENLKKDDKFQRSVQGQDVTEEYVDLNSRLKAKQVVEDRLLKFMEEATDTRNLLQFSNELASVQEQIEQIKGRIRYIDENVAYSTIEIRMYETLEKREDDSDEELNAFKRAGTAMKDSASAVVSFFEALLIVIAGALPILIVLLLILVPIWIAYRKTRYRNGGNSSKPSASQSYATVVAPGDEAAAPHSSKDVDDSAEANEDDMNEAENDKSKD